METKPWWQSKTVWATVLTVVLTIFTIMRVDHVGAVTAEGLAAEQVNLTELLAQLGVIASGFVALYGRLTARTSLTAPKPGE